MSGPARILYCPLLSIWLITPKYSAPIPKTTISRIGTIGMIKQAKMYFIFPTIALTTAFVLKYMQILRHGTHRLLMLLFMHNITDYVGIDSSWTFLDKGKGKNNEKVFPDIRKAPVLSILMILNARCWQKVDSDSLMDQTSSPCETRMRTKIHP
jgi:hypothetical protein